MKFFLALLCWPALGQPLLVYSEFAKIDKAGEVTAPETPREILSPAIGRNAFASFQVVVKAPAGKPWRLYVGQNPSNAVRVTMYRENGESLTPAELPVESEGGPAVFWMDVWTERGATVQRIKIEPELFLDNDWVIYPMEARVVEATVPEAPKAEGFLPPAQVMKGYLCPGPLTAFLASSDVARMQFRNAQQDVALASKGSKDELKKLFGACDAAVPQNPEWYLRIRDYLLRLR